MVSHDQMRSGQAAFNAAGALARRLVKYWGAVGRPLEEVCSSDRAELAPLERGGENTLPATNHSTLGEKLERHPSIQQEGPLNTHLHSRTHFAFVWGNDALRDYQDAAAAHIDDAARTGEGRRSGGKAEANAQVQWIA